jgi:hypothetical protein
MEELPKGNSITHLIFFIKKIKNNEPFALVRPGDGELMIMNGQHFGTQDKWRFDGGNLQSELRDALYKLAHGKNTYVGIACKDCQGDRVVNWFINTFNTPLHKFTYANIFCNKQYKLFINFLSNSHTPFHYIGPGRCTLNNELNIVDRFYIHELQIQTWDRDRNQLITELENWIRVKIENGHTLFLFSCGPLAKIFVQIFFEKYPNCTFLDVGSALDLFTKGNTNRRYINDTNYYANIICDFEKGHSN